jgi:uncharacterized damage-inducible protein DinB
MTDARLTEILAVLDPKPGKPLWHGGASPLGSLRGVSPELAAWKPYRGGHSIWEFTLHIAYWKYAVRRRLEDSAVGGFPRSPADWPAMPKGRDDKSWRSDRSLLREEHETLIAAIRSFDPKRLDEKASGRKVYRYLDLLHGVVMHDTYHVGQVQLLKRMYRARKSKAK